VATYRAKNSQIVYQLQSTALGKGGEGSVYEIARHPSLVAKLYHPQKLTPALEQKLNAMVANTPDDDTRRTLNHVSIAWPADTLYNGSHFVGYVMPKILKSDDIYALIQPQQRAKKYPKANHQMLYRVARNLATAVASIHRKNHIIGDINFKNALFNDQSLITLVDCDSMQVRDARGNIHRCLVGLPEFTAPELQGADFSKVSRTQHSDTFGLATLIFQLVMQGFHPFAGRSLPGAPDVELVQVYCITHKIFPYVPNNQFVPPPAAPAFDALPSILQSLFTQAFTTHTRPSAAEWANALALVEKRLISCTNNRVHMHPRDGKCVICAVTSNTQSMKVRKPSTPPLHPKPTQVPLPQVTPQPVLPHQAPQTPIPTSNTQMQSPPQHGYAGLFWSICVLVVVLYVANPIMTGLSYATDLWSTIFRPGQTIQFDGGADLDGASTYATEQASVTTTPRSSDVDLPVNNVIMATPLITDSQNTSATSNQQAHTAATQPYLWIRKKEGKDTLDCISIQITGIDTLYWRLAARNSPLTPAVFDGGGNARLCDDSNKGIIWISQQQGFYIDILNPNMDPVPGGIAPAKGGDIFIASWEK
jgi:DNA-binding helix-hairpin-helix protein with protein kinase domain